MTKIECCGAWLGGAWSCLVLKENDQRTHSKSKWCQPLVIEPVVHHGTMVPFYKYIFWDNLYCLRQEKPLPGLWEWTLTHSLLVTCTERLSRWFLWWNFPFTCIFAAQQIFSSKLTDWNIDQDGSSIAAVNPEGKVMGVRVGNVTKR